MRLRSLAVPRPPSERRHAIETASGGPRLRVALLAGGLDRGGAEKQLLYVVRVLLAAGADVRVYSVRLEGHYRDALRAHGIEPVWLGTFGGPPGRLFRLVRLLSEFRPHVIQSTHSFMNLYAGLAGRWLGSPSLGALRSSLGFCRRANGRWTPWLMSVPAGLVVNSEAARREVRMESSVDPARLFVLPNAVDVEEYAVEPRTGVAVEGSGRPPAAAFVGRLIPSKRLDLFLRALAVTRASGVPLRGMVIGDGPELVPGRALASELGLLPEDCSFLGERSDLPSLLGTADMLVHCSDDEGFPNVLIEGMAAGLPIVSTPAGDSATIVSTGPSGLVVPFGDVEGMAAAMVRLATSPRLGREFGAAGRDLVRKRFSLANLSERLLDVYRSMAQLERDDETLALIARCGQ
jgi:glycosyltransferase involved in cell wall biosynthesis